MVARVVGFATECGTKSEGSLLLDLSGKGELVAFCGIGSAL